MTSEERAKSFVQAVKQASDKYQVGLYGYDDGLHLHVFSVGEELVNKRCISQLEEIMPEENEK